MLSTTYCCITLHMHAYLFNFLLFDSGEDGGVGSLTKKQCFTWGQKNPTIIQTPSIRDVLANATLLAFQ